MKKVPNDAPPHEYELDPYVFTLIAIVFLLGANWLYAFSKERPALQAVTLPSEILTITETPLVNPALREKTRMEEMLAVYVNHTEKINPLDYADPVEPEYDVDPEDFATTTSTHNGDGNDGPVLLTTPNSAVLRGEKFLLYPRGGETFCFGQDLHIFWNRRVTDAAVVDVHLVSPGSTIRLDSISRTEGTYLWHIQPIHTTTTGKIESTEVPPNDVYSIALDVLTPFMPGHNMSQNFSIRDCSKKKTTP